MRPHLLPYWAWLGAVCSEWAIEAYWGRGHLLPSFIIRKEQLWVYSGTYDYFSLCLEMEDAGLALQSCPQLLVRTQALPGR